MEELVFHEDDAVKITNYRIRVGNEEFLTRWLVGYGLRRPFPWLALFLLILAILSLYFFWSDIGDKWYIPLGLLIAAILAYLLSPKYLHLYFAEGYARAIKTTKASYVQSLFQSLRALAIYLGEMEHKKREGSS